MDPEEEETDPLLEETIKNPPKGVTIHESAGQTTVRVYTHSSYWSIGMLSLFIVFVLPVLLLLGFKYGYYEQVINRVVSGAIFEKTKLLFAVGRVFYILIPIVSAGLVIKVLYNILYAAFGKIELACGQRNYIFYGIYKFGKKRQANWKHLTYCHQNSTFPDAGLTITAPTTILVGGYPVITPFESTTFISKESANTIRNDYIIIRFTNKKTIKIHPKYLSDKKVNYILSTASYFKHKPIPTSSFLLPHYYKEFL